MLARAAYSEVVGGEPRECQRPVDGCWVARHESRVLHDSRVLDDDFGIAAQRRLDEGHAVGATRKLATYLDRSTDRNRVPVVRLGSAQFRIDTAAGRCDEERPLPGS